MIDVDLPQTEGIPEIVRSFAACVASVTETPLSDVPQPRADLRGAIAHWRSWLAGRGAGLVPIAQPARFNWPGYWLAVLGGPAPAGATEDGTAVLMFTILGIVDSRSPGDLAGIVIGGVVIAIIMIVGPITGASLNPARAFGPELVSALGGGKAFWSQLLPVYILPGLVGAGVAAVAYDFLAKPRLVVEPVIEAVTHPDPAVPEPATSSVH